MVITCLLLIVMFFLFFFIMIRMFLLVPLLLLWYIAVMLNFKSGNLSILIELILIVVLPKQFCLHAWFITEIAIHEFINKPL